MRAQTANRASEQDTVYLSRRLRYCDLDNEPCDVRRTDARALCGPTYAPFGRGQPR